MVIGSGVGSGGGRTAGIRSSDRRKDEATKGIDG